jgi:hypothetical protein
VRDEAHTYRDGVPPDVRGQLFALGGGELFAVADVPDPREVRVGVQDYSSRRHRPGERPATDFVYSGDEIKSLAPQETLLSEGWSRSHDVVPYYSWPEACVNRHRHFIHYLFTPVHR